MSDQADQLRILAQSTAVETVDAIVPPLIFITGGQPGVGVTSLASELAIEFSRRGLRVTLVDADPSKPNAAERLGVCSDASIDDVYSGSRTVQEVLTLGPSGVQIVPGARSPGGQSTSPDGYKRLLNGIQRMASTADLVLVDGGNSASPATTRFWSCASLVLLMTSPDAEAIMSAYGAVKLAVEAGGDNPPITTVVSGDVPPAARDDVHTRLSNACERFLRVTLQMSPTPLSIDSKRMDSVFLDYVENTVCKPTKNERRLHRDAAA